MQIVPFKTHLPMEGMSPELMDTMGIWPSLQRFEEHIHCQVIGPMTPFFATSTISSQEVMFGSHQLLKLTLVLTLNDSSMSLVVTELFMSWMILTQLEEHLGFWTWWKEIEVTAWPLQEACCLLWLYLWMLSSEIWQHTPTGNCTGGGTGLAEAPAWALVMGCVCVFFTIHFQAAHFDTLWVLS